MGHMIDNSKGFDACAWSGETPWHKLGYQLRPGENTNLDVVTAKAGLDYNVKAGKVHFVCVDGADGSQASYSFPNRSVLYRDDNAHPLGILSEGYKIVQPRTVLEFFREILEREGATIEVAGALDGGRRVWALAKLNLAMRDVFDGDIVEPYLLCATSYDGSMSTVAKLTAIRVVCHNTMTAAVGYRDEGQEEHGRPEAIIRIPHSADFDPAKTRIDLGVTLGAWERFMFTSRKLARTTVTDGFVSKFLTALLPVQPEGKPIEGTKAYQSIEALYNGGAQGATLVSSQGTAFGLLNAVTQFVDHARGRDGKRLSSAWFGTGDSLKARAMFLLENADYRSA